MNWRAHYILNPDHTLSEVDLITWALWFENADRQVALTELAPGIGVSTVFLGLDHRFHGNGPPIVFETMWFNDYGFDGGERYATWDEAVAGHERNVEELKAKMEGRKVGHD